MKQLIIVVLMLLSFYSYASEDTNGLSAISLKIRESHSASEIAVLLKEISKIFDHSSNQLQEDECGSLPDNDAQLANLSKDNGEENVFQNAAWCALSDVVGSIKLANKITDNVFQSQKKEHEKNMVILGKKRDTLVSRIEKLDVAKDNNQFVQSIILYQLVKNGMATLDHLVGFHNNIVRYQNRYSL